MRVVTLSLFIAFAMSVSGNVILIKDYVDGTRLGDVTLAPVDRIEVIRTKGGLLQVSTLKAPEMFQATKDHRFFGVSIGKTTTHIQVPAFYHYHIELAPEWKVTVRDNMFIVVAPKVKPTLPIAVDMARLQGFSSGSWSILTGQKELDILQRSITKTLETKASTPSYINIQREVARKTVEEFVEKWLINQGKWESKKSNNAIKVFFEDESIGSMQSVIQSRSSI
jgi:hypothetical protein